MGVYLYLFSILQLAVRIRYNAFASVVLYLGYTVGGVRGPVSCLPPDGNHLFMAKTPARGHGSVTGSDTVISGAKMSVHTVAFLLQRRA